MALSAFIVISGLIPCGMLSDKRPPQKTLKSPFFGAGINNPLWMRSYSISNLEEASAVRQTNDGSYIIGGYTHDQTNMHDLLLYKLSPYGRVLWQKRLGGSEYEAATDIQQTYDGGYIVVGYKGSYTYENLNFWVLKFDENGNVVWQKEFGDIGSDTAYSVHQMTDEGYIIGGHVDSQQGNNEDAWALKLFPDGSIEWNQVFGGSKIDEARCIRQTSDKGYVFCGKTSSEGRGGTDLMVIKLGINREIEWQMGYGGTKDDAAYYIEQTNDKGYIVAGGTKSYGAGGEDMWILKLDFNGIAQWQLTYGGDYDDCAFSVQQIENQNYIVAGTVQKTSGGPKYIWLLQLDEAGGIEWQKIYGKNEDDYAYCARQTKGGGIITAGSTKSYSSAGTNIFVMKTDGEGNVDSTCDLSETFAPQITESSARWYELDFVPRELSLISNQTNNPTQIPETKSTLICWNYIQPPVNIVLGRQINRLLGFEEATNTLNWEASPENAGFTIKQYKIYRRNTFSGSKEFEHIATVSSGVYTYSDSGLIPDQIFQYAISSVDEMDLESPLSSPVDQTSD